MPTPTILTGSNLSWSTVFDLTGTPKIFGFTDDNPYTAANIALTGVRGVFEITTPSSVVVYNNTSYGAGSDIVANVALTNAIPIQIPNLANQSPEQGVYTITYTVQIIDGTNPTYYISKTSTYNFVYDSPVVSIVPQVDCIQPLFTASDTTDYVVNAVTPSNSRVMTLDYPANSGGTPITNSSSATITTSTFYNGLQAITVNSTLAYTFSNFTVNDIVSGTKSINVDCSYVCQLYCCLKSLNTRLDATRGVNDVLFEQYSEQFSEIMGKVELLFLAIDCGKQEDANSLIASIKTLANCTDDCSCTDGTPTQVTGLGIQNVNVAVVSGGSPITVTGNTSGGITTYTVSFSAALVTKINNSYNTVVQNTDGTITVVPSGVIANVQTYTISANYPSAQNRMEFLCRIQYTAVNAATITNSGYLYSGANMNATATVASTTLPTAALNNNFRVNAFQVASNNNYKVTTELVIVTFHGTHTYTLNGVKPFNIEVLNKTSGAFDFRFVDMNGLPITNTQMLNVPDMYINIKISE